MEKNNEKITVNQHYVPRFYMKNFAEIKGSGKKEKALITFYQFDGELLKNDIPTKSICYEEYFYGKDGKIEKDFASKETVWAQTIQNIIHNNKEELTKEQKGQIKQFAIFQYCRTLAMYNYSTCMITEMITSHVDNSIPKSEADLAHKIISKKVQDEVSVEDIISICDELIQVIDDLDVSIIKYNTKNKLITSDMPIIVMNPFLQHNIGFNNVGIVILFPISQEVMVAIYDGKIYRNPANIIVSDEQEVINLNKYQVISAEERIMSKKQEELVDFYNNAELMLIRNEYQSKNKVNSSFDGKGTFIAAKARSMPYYFELSFCVLPKYIRKIPSDCRNSVGRDYNYKERIKLLVSEYRIPQLITGDVGCSQEQVLKMEDGYSKMRRFMDDYWNLPVNERTISPELMFKLKTVPVNFIPINEGKIL